MRSRANCSTGTSKSGRSAGVERSDLADLVEDLSVYPRTKVDQNNVRNIVDAIHAGVRLPAIIACAETLRVVDGVHRRRAYLKVLDEGPEARVRVELRRYESEAELLADAVKLNTGRGKDLDEYEKRKVTFRLNELGIGDDEVAKILRIPPPRVTAIKLRVAHVTTPKGGPVRLEVLKGSVRHFTGGQMTQAQAQAHKSAPGTPYSLLIKQLRDAINVGLLNANDGRVITGLRGLYLELGEYLEGLPE